MKVTIEIDLDKLNPILECPVSAELCVVLKRLADKVFGADFNEAFDRKLTIKDDSGNDVGRMVVA